MIKANYDALRKFALLVNGEFLGVYNSFKEAEKAGLEKKGKGPMLIKRITKGCYPPTKISGKMDVKGVKRRATYADLLMSEDDRNLPDKEFPYHAGFID
jgi:hypothetical protein